MILIIGLTCPLTIHFKFITKCDDYYKVRQNIRDFTALLLRSGIHYILATGAEL